MVITVIAADRASPRTDSGQKCRRGKKSVQATQLPQTASENANGLSPPSFPSLFPSFFPGDATMFDAIRAFRAGVDWVHEKVAPEHPKPAPPPPPPRPVQQADGVEPTHTGGAAAHAAWRHEGDKVDLSLAANHQALPASPPRAPAADPAGAASRILDVGSRFGTDDYEARTVAFAQEMEKGDPAYRQNLMAEILKKDKGALDSWFTPERANAMERTGRITNDQKAAMADGLAYAYNHHLIPEAEIGVGPVPGTGADGKMKFNTLDNVVGGFSTQGSFDQVENAKRVREFIDFASSSNSSETQQFRQDYAKHLLDEVVLNKAVGYNNPVERDAAAGLAANLLASNSPEATVKLLAGYDKDLPAILDAAARSNSIYGADVLKVPASDRRLDSKDIAPYDGATLLMLSVARADKSPNDPALDKALDTVSLDLGRLPSSNPAIFEGPGGKDRVDALTLAFTRHPEPILNELTKYDSTYIGGTEKPDLQQYMENASELGALFKLTLFSPDSTYREGLQAKVVDYAGGLAAQINQPGAGGDAVGRMAMLQAGLTDAVRQGYQELAKDEKARKQVLGFVMDLALSALPAGKWVSGAAEKVILDTFGNNPRLQEALKGVSGKLIDGTTGKITDAAKEKILSTLGSEAGSVEIAKNAVNQLNENFMKQLDEKDYDRNQVQTTYNQILNGISIARHG
jgi:hypothetical protein